MNDLQLYGNIFYEPKNHKWNGSGVGWWIEKSHENSAKITFEERLWFDPDRPSDKRSYQLALSNINQYGDIEVYNMDEDGFFLRWMGVGTEMCEASFTVRGHQKSFVPDDRKLTNEESVADVYAAGLLFHYEAKYGVVTVMGSATIQCKEIAEESLDILSSHVDYYQSAIEKEDDTLGKELLADKLSKTQIRMARHRTIVERSARYSDSAKKFGKLWGRYAAEEQEEALGGCYVPICTGGGPGIMQAVAQGAREQNAHVVGIDCQFGYDNFFDLKDSYSVYSNQRLRMNNFSIREGVLINYSHVILFWPGGYGTAWEVFETLSKISTNHLRRRRTKAIFVHQDYWEPMFRFIDEMRAFGAINSYGDRIKIPGVDDALPDEAYIAEAVDTAEEAFEKTRAFVEELYARNMLTLRT